MDDAVRVRILQRVGNLGSVARDAVSRESPSENEAAERPPLDMLHDDERDAIGVADFVNRADVRVIESGCVLGFAEQPPSTVVVVRRVFSLMATVRPNRVSRAR